MTSSKSSQNRDWIRRSAHTRARERVVGRSHDDADDDDEYDVVDFDHDGDARVDGNARGQ